MRSFLFLIAMPLLASAWSEHTLLTRATGNATCEESDKVCGAFCIPSSYTCCPDLEGGCSTSKSFCQEGDNGVYGCCPIGETCIGDGGAEFLDDPDDDVTSTSTTSSSSATDTAVSSTNAAQPLVLSSTLTLAVAAAGIAALL